MDSARGPRGCWAGRSSPSNMSTVRASTRLRHGYCGCTPATRRGTSRASRHRQLADLIDCVRYGYGRDDNGAYGM
ncbi:hypothetical protein CC86DRAFT_373879 [Ophiobolus disseminans]|uniref:Uncharacterized protein n=1 Tax=Ophiobolus disseminans TaxID=1469910 RepID=A0A6A6ZMK2_9PLEO|nr:hypothetical protein CC86DRAFT_373879 [Ophiobolus disseminans]